MGKPIRLSLLAGAATAFALAMMAPAAAQYRAPYAAPHYQESGIDARIGQLRVRLDAQHRSGIIGRGEYSALRARLDDITRLQRLYFRNGLNAAERADLDRRVRDFRLEFRQAADRGGSFVREDYGRDDDDRDGRDSAWNDRDGGYGHSDDARDEDNVRGDQDNDRGGDDNYRGGDSDGRGDVDEDDGYRSDQRVDSNRDGWDDRDRDRDGRWEDDSEDLESDDSGGTLRVGQRATGNLGGVPYQYRDRYRDGGGVYYRSDGRAIYQIDARTKAVVRIYAIGR